MSLPRIDSRSPLHDSHHDHKTSSSAMSFAPQLLSVLHPRKVKYRTTIIGLLFFVFLTTYIFLVHGTTLSSTIALHAAPATDQLAVAIESIQNSRVSEGSNGGEAVPAHHHHIYNPSYHKGKGRNRHQYPPLKLNKEQELGAISSFIASLPQNVIPPFVDPSQPIDPQLVLDFDTRTERAQDEVRAVVEDVWMRNPVFVYSKRYSPQSRELKSILADLYLLPSPTIVDVDTREDADVLQPILARLTSTSELPLLLVGGKLVGSLDEIKEMSKNGELENLVSAAGAVVNGAKKKKHRK